MGPTPVSILFVNDDCKDRYLISEAFDESGGENRLFIVESGDDLLSYLKGKGEYANRYYYPLPSLILLDLSTPMVDSREALTEIKKEPELRQIPIIVLATSQEEENIQDNFGLDITGFIKKPITFSDLLGVIKTVSNYWFQTVILPAQ